VTAEQRPCPACGNQFTWTPAAPRQKYCSPRCKHRWHDRYGKKALRRRRGGPATDVARPPAAAGQLAPPEPGSSMTAAPACPHCRQPVALVAWLVPPAASITTPPQHISNTTRSNSP
jgi:endogenous inhibitor of DNA gyrase (YacG/DUF329 family)